MGLAFVGHNTAQSKGGISIYSFTPRAKVNAPSYQKEYFQKGIGALLCDCPRSQSRPSFLNFLSFGLTSEGLNFDVLWGPMGPSKNIVFFELSCCEPCYYLVWRLQKI